MSSRRKIAARRKGQHQRLLAERRPHLFRRFTPEELNSARDTFMEEMRGKWWPQRLAPLPTEYSPTRHASAPALTLDGLTEMVERVRAHTPAPTLTMHPLDLEIILAHTDLLPTRPAAAQDVIAARLYGCPVNLDPRIPRGSIRVANLPEEHPDAL